MNEGLGITGGGQDGCYRSDEVEKKEVVACMATARAGERLRDGPGAGGRVCDGEDDAGSERSKAVPEAPVDVVAKAEQDRADCNRQRGWCLQSTQ